MTRRLQLIGWGVVGAVLLCSLVGTEPALADDLGCYTSGETVRGAFAQYTGTATSVVADVYDYDDLVDGTGYAEPAMTDLGGNNWGAADFTAGATTGAHKVVMVATVGGSSVTLVDTFVVATACPMATYTQPTGFLAATFPTTVASPTNITGGTITTVTNLTNLPSIPADWITAAGIADSALRVTSELSVTRCDISAATSGTSFTIATCTSVMGETITLADGSFSGRMMEAYTNGGAQCNVVGERVFVQTTVAGVVTVRTSTVTGGQGGFTLTPSSTNCGVYF